MKEAIAITALSLALVMPFSGYSAAEPDYLARFNNTRIMEQS